MFPEASNRREFIKRMAGAGMALPVLASREASSASNNSEAPLENEVFRVGFDIPSGRLEVRRQGGQALLSGAYVRVHTIEGVRTTIDSAYSHAVETTSLRDKLGEGRQLVVRSSDAKRQLDIDLRITLYDGQPMVVFEATCRNVSTQPIILGSLEPVCAVREQDGGLHWPDTAKILTNGPMYYDPGVVADFSLPDPKMWRSWWNIGVFSGYQREGLVCGYLDNQVALGQVAMRREDHHVISLMAESVFAKGFELHPGGSIRSGRFLLNMAPTPYQALEDYAGTMGRLHEARVYSVINGWCSWFYTYEHVTEEEVLRNAEFAARVLRPLGLEYIQVDEGYQRWHGDWEGNPRFPHGMKWLADRIRGLGLKPGLWIAPYVISEPTAVFQEHPGWLLHHPDGRLKRVGPWPSEDSDWARNENPKRYGLDITHPDAAAWLSNLFDTVGRQWGYEMVKIDFVDWSLLAAHRYHDPTVTRAAAYRRGFEIMRRSLGTACHLQDCGPGPVSVGLSDSMRIELDQNYGYRQRAWQQYFLRSTSSASAAAKRYYFHKRTWINDADHACLAHLTLSQAQAAVSLLALSGGNLISGDRLPELDPTRLEILKKILPAWGEAARPVDLFDTDQPTVFALPIRRPFGEWTVIGVFNPSETDLVTHRLPLDRLRLDPRKTWVAYDFWNEGFHGEVTREMRLTVLPASVTLLALREKRGVPQVIGTDRHVLQGVHELEHVTWDQETRRLSGVSLGPMGSAHNLAVYVPEARPWRQGNHVLHHDHPGYSLRMADEHILRVHVQFDQAERLSWQIDFNDFFQGSM
ncbi:MAG TPA: alpha-galactosidase [Candidatus Paceibacterota bacterium]|nr:alpha-galactosidase [Verrucomicrobiota bacterium]HRY51359.1 alpha-galactosidase [Candidatus Paceibacterota bacterium]